MTWLTSLLPIGALLALVFVGLTAFGSMRWTDATRRLTARLEAGRLPASLGRYDPRELEGLPAPVQRYFRAVLKEGQPLIAELNYGTGNATAILANGLFAAQHKLDMAHIPYKGDGPLSLDLIAGRVNVAFATPGTLAPQVKEGKLRVLATMLPSRNQLLPTAPTMAEAGLANVPITPWGGLFGPPKLPKEIVDRVGRELAIVLAKPEVKDAFGKLAFEPRSSTPQALSAFVAEQLEAYRRGAREMNLSLD